MELGKEMETSGVRHTVRKRDSCGAEKVGGRDAEKTNATTNGELK